MASITLTSGSTTREIELLDAINDDTADNVTIGSYYAELTDDISLTNGTPLLTFTKNGTTKYIREVFGQGVGDIVTTPSGRTLQRHNSGKGTIVTWYNYAKSQQESFVVVDAQYRVKKGWGNVAVSGLNTYTTSNTSGNWHLDGTGFMTIANGRWPCTMTDQALYDLWKNSFDTNTAKQNTDVLIANSTTHKAAYYCRGVRLGTEACDLPNITQLQIIAIEADQLDAMDPTAEDKATYAFGALNSESTTAYMYPYWWSSTYYGTSDDSCYARGVKYNGFCGFSLGSNPGSIVPVLEL